MASDNDRAAIRQAYLDYLGREASEADVEGWATGQFGGGGLNDWLNQIQNSGEGQAYQQDQADRVEEGRLQAIRDQEARDAANRNQSNQTMGNMIPEGFSDDQTSGPEYDPYAGGRGRGPNTRVGGNTTIPPNTGATGFSGSQGGNTYQSASQKIQDAYRTYLGRDASPQEISDQLSGGRYFAPENVRHAVNGIRTSEEAGLYRNREDTETAVKDDLIEDDFLPPPADEPSGRTGQAPGGFDQTKWESDHGSVKYDAGGFLSGLTKPSEIDAMVKSAAFQARFPGATFNGKDKIDFGNNLQDGVPVGVVDVLMRADQAGDTSGGFWWGADSGDGVSSPDPGGEIPDTGVGGDGGIVPSQNPLSAPVLAPPPNTFGMGPGGGGGMMGPGGGGGTMGQMITPYNPLAAYSPETYVPPDPYRPPAYAAATPYQPGTYDAAVPFSRDEYVAATPFEAPTAADMAADPSYQFRLQQGQDALERSGAARGVTNTGGTLKDILDYGQNAASQEYGNVYGRMRDTYDANEKNRFNAYAANYANAMAGHAMNEQTRFGAFGENERNRAGAFSRNEANRASGFDRNVRNAENAYATNAANRYQAYTTNQMARLNENQTAEQRRAGAYNTNLNAYQNQQNYGLRAQGQRFDQDFRNWNTQWNQQRMNQNDRFNQMYQLGGAQ